MAINTSHISYHNNSKIKFAPVARPPWMLENADLGVYVAPATLNYPLTQDYYPTTLALVSGNLPTGISLTHVGLTGTIVDSLTSSTQTFTFTVRSTNTQNKTTDKQFTMTVVYSGSAPYWMSPEVNHSFQFNQFSSVNCQMQVLNADSFVLQGGTLPTGVTINSNGYLNGVTPGVTQTTSKTFTVRAVNAHGVSDRNFTITVLHSVTPIWITPSLVVPNTTTNMFDEDASVDFQFNARFVDTYSVVDGNLPDSLTLDEYGHLSGTLPEIPYQSTYNFTIRASNSYGDTDKVFTIVEKDLYPYWNTQDGSIGTFGELSTINVSLDVTNTASIAIQSGALPAGVSLVTSGSLTNVTGVISGILSADLSQNTVYNFVLRATNTNGYRDRNLSMLIKDTTLPTWVSTVNLGSFDEASSINTQLVATHATGFVGVGLGPIPNGLTLSPLGLIHGTVAPVLETKTYTTTIRAMNANGHLDKDFAITINKIFPSWIYAWPNTSFDLGSFDKLTSINSPFTSDMVVGATSFALQSGTLPPGITINPNGSISGVLTEDITENKFYDFYVRASNTQGHDDAEFTMAVKTIYPYWETAGDLGTFYELASIDITMAALNSTTNSLQSGSIPLTHTPGTEYNLDGTLLFDWSPPNYDGSGVISHVVGRMPLANQDITYTFTLRATNSHGYVDKIFTITNKHAYPVWVSPGITDTKDELVAVSYQVTATSATSIVVLDNLQSHLAPGLSLTTVTTSLTTIGTLSGTLSPTTVDTDYAFTLRAANDVEHLDLNCSISVNSIYPYWITDTGSLGEYGEYGTIDAVLEAYNATSYVIQTGTLPQGISLNSSNGEFTGTMTQALTNSTTYNFTVRASNTKGHVDRDFSLVVSLIPSWNVGTTGGVTIIGTYPELGTVTYQCSATGASSIVFNSGIIPAGLTVSSAGVINGTMTNEITQTTTYTFGLRAINNTGYADRKFSLIVTDTYPNWFTPSDVGLGPYDELTAVNYQLSVTNATSIVLQSGTLPVGLLVSNTGVINGTMTQDLTQDTDYTFVARASNANGFRDRTFTVSVHDLNVHWVTPAGSLGTFDELLTLYATTNPQCNIQVNNADTVTIQAGTLPPGTSLMSFRGVYYISGTLALLNPAQTTTYTFTLRATNAHEHVDRIFSMVVSYVYPRWTTPAGLIATYNELAQNVHTSVVATNATSYTLISGFLPPGLGVSNGIITGSLTSDVDGDTIFNFTIRASNAHKSVDRVFSIKVIDIFPNWETAPPHLGSYKSMSVVNFAVKASNSTIISLPSSSSTTTTTSGMSSIIQGGL